MQLVKPSIEWFDIETDPLKAIELAGRICYKSEDKICEGSAEKFVQMLLDREHYAMIEHSNIILEMSDTIYEEIQQATDRSFLRLSWNDDTSTQSFVSGNARAFMEFCVQPDVEQCTQRILAIVLSKHIPLLFEPALEYTKHLQQYDAEVEPIGIVTDMNRLSHSEQLKHRIMSYRIVCNRGFTHEQVRHRPVSYAQESTRYCNDKGGVAFIIPPEVNLQEGIYKTAMNSGIIQVSPYLDLARTESIWLAAMASDEVRYQDLIASGWKPQKARGVLPIDLKTEIVVTCNLQQWRHFFKMRCTPLRVPKEDLVNGIWYHATAPHPQMQEVANMILHDAVERIPTFFEEFLS